MDIKMSSCRTLTLFKCIGTKLFIQCQQNRLKSVHPLGGVTLRSSWCNFFTISVRFKLIIITISALNLFILTKLRHMQTRPRTSLSRAQASYFCWPNFVDLNPTIKSVGPGLIQTWVSGVNTSPILLFSATCSILLLLKQP